MTDDKGRHCKTRKEVTLDSGVLEVRVRTSVGKVELTGLAATERRE